MHLRKLLLLSFLWGFFLLARGELTEAQMDTWLNDSPEEQLRNEARDDVKGLGRIFVPAMSESDYEPNVSVWDANGNFFADSKTANSIFVLPGEYIVLLGSGDMSQKIRKDVVVEREQNHIIEPDWAELVIRIIYENREPVKLDYEIFSAETAESYGYGQGFNEEVGELPTAWVLPAGLYKIVLGGAPFNTYQNFTTVDLRPGELKQYTLVINSTTNNLIGAGVLTMEIAAHRKEQKMQIRNALHGSFILNNDNSVDQNDPDQNLSIDMQLDNQIKYDSDKFYVNSRNLFEASMSRQGSESFRLLQNNLQLQNTFIYYFFYFLGAYCRADASFEPFPITEYFDEPQTVRLEDEKGNLLQLLYNRKDFERAPSFYPIKLKEGIGFNLAAFRSNRVSLSVRGGLGFRQDIYEDVYEKEKDTLFVRMESSYNNGMEASMVGSFNILSNLTYNMNFDFLFPFEKKSDPVFELENIVTWRLLRNVSIDYRLTFNQNREVRDYVSRTHVLNLRLSYFF